MTQPHSDFPRTHQPDRPYDWTAPYDWAIEDIFDDEPEASPSRPSRWKPLANMAMAGAAVLGSQLALIIGAYEVKKHFFAVEAQDIPAKLPSPIKRVAESAVKIKYNVGSPDGSGGSGVKIGTDLVLTAGHVVSEGSHGSLQCEDSYTLNVNTYGNYSDSNILSSNGVDSDSRDLAVLQVEQNYPFYFLPTALMAVNQPEKGEPVFFINYEGVSDDPTSLDRYPNEELAAAWDGEAARVYGHPAEYAGTVVGHAGSFLLVATEQQGYGPEPGRETTTYPGASGGPVFNRAGRLVGIVTASDESNNGISITLRHGVNLQDGPLDKVQVTVVQPVTKDIVRPLVRGLPEEQPVC